MLQRKLRELCGGWEAHLRCQLPTEDLDALISVTCDDDLAKLLEEYDEATKDRLQLLKIRYPFYASLLNSKSNEQQKKIRYPVAQE